MRNLLFLAFLWAGSALAQGNLQLLQSIKPRAIGPAGMSGRVTSIAVVQKQPNIIYAGTASGGLWKSDNGGIAWQPVFDKADVGSIGAVAIQQNNPSVVWAGTGEGNPRNSHNSGKGIYRSGDAGKTWVNMGLENTKTIHRIQIDPLNPNRIFVAAMGSVWGPGQDRGVYRTEDGGKTWTRVLFTNENSGCAELSMDPSNPDKLFAAMWEYGRKPYTFNSGGPGSGLYMTIDGGKNWKKISTKDGIPEGNLGRIGIAIAPSNPNVVYTIIESKTLDLYKSTDGGYAWSKVSSSPNIGNRPFYYNELYCDPKNENKIYSLWSQVSTSDDGGKHWEVYLDWGHVHPDHHAFYIHPDNPLFQINGNDGGLNITYDGGKNWRYIANLPVGQFYHVRVDDAVPYNIYGGLQDNGSWRGPGYTWKDGGIRNSDWKELLFGDGFDVVPVPGNPNKGYAMWQGGNVYFYDIISGRNQAVQPVHPDGKYLRFNWNAGIGIQPKQPNVVYFGSQFLHKSWNNGLSWKIISPDLTTNDTAKLHQAKSGGLTIDATNAENYCTIITIVPSVSDTNVVWVGTDDGNVQLTRDGGKTWMNLTSKIIGAPKNAWIPFIHVSKNNAGEAWVIMNNYRQNDWAPYLFKTTDYGQTWQRMADGTKVKGHCLSVMPDPVEPKLVFLGTDHGLWISIDGGNTYEKWTSGMPSCPVQDMVLQEKENDLVIATFGRSMFVFDDITPFRKLAAGFKTNDQQVKIMHASDGYLANFQRPEGERFGADALYEGENKMYGSIITLYVNGTKNSKTGKWEKTKYTGEVYDAKGNKIRTHKFSFDSGGVYRFPYRFIQDGFHYPSHHTPDPDAGLPAGRSILPGKYKLVIRQGKYADSQEIEVKANPNEPVNMEGELKKQAMYQRLKTAATRAQQGYEGLKTAEKTIETLLTLNYVNDTAAKRLEKLAKPLRDSLKVLKDLFMQAADVNYIEDITQRLNDKLGAAAGFIESNVTPQGNAETALIIAEKETEKVLARVNAFFANQWKTFEEEAKKEQIKPFKNLGNY